MTSPADRSRRLREELLSDAMREKYRSQLMNSIGGWSGTVVASIPTIVFVAVNLVASLRTAVLTAIGSAAVLAVYRLVRRQPVSQALAGVGAVAVAALIASYTGQARNYFLIGILASFGYGTAFALSMVVRRPLVGLMWEFLDPITRHLEVTDGQDPAHDGARGRAAVPWWQRPELRRAYQLATLGGAVLFLTRGVVQLTLYLSHRTTWLGVARVVMGYPMWISAVIFAFWVVRRARHRLTGPPAPPA